MSANTCPGGGDLTEQGVGVARDPVVVALVRDPFATALLTSVKGSGRTQAVINVSPPDTP
jgi:hypothetical protein